MTCVHLRNKRCLLCLHRRMQTEDTFARTRELISPRPRPKVLVGGDEDFEVEPWTLMQERVLKDFPDVAESIASLLQKARSQKLEKGKVLFLSALVKAFCTNGLDASVVLKDPSGEICGTLHQKVLEERPAEFDTGCGLFLKKVSVFSPSVRKHYLNITPGNILEIFPANVKTDCRRDEKLSDTLNRKELEPTESEQHASIDVNKNAGVKQTDGSFEELLRGLDDDDDDLLMQAMNL
ncbi:homologous recombination OB-fold protein-like isoform X2 [Xenia sp. Carnegie-2017]|uniref:homologous recombination OB-fold protein-like isoform X2 n=1 Tax=Xenia sp. Carnegie-2017 TaxID=2897299 RepID=UPI001F035B88|nr:homologous recombination OB-fold protein-like isoform X2 [Xenia sp. Carnegie-2017]